MYARTDGFGIAGGVITTIFSDKQEWEIVACFFRTFLYSMCKKISKYIDLHAVCSLFKNNIRRHGVVHCYCDFTKNRFVFVSLNVGVAYLVT